MVVSEQLLNKTKTALRVSTSDFDENIKDEILACLLDLRRVGVFSIAQTHPLIMSAVKLWCKAYFLQDNESEKFKLAYESIRDSMALSEEYKDGE